MYVPEHSGAATLETGQKVGWLNGSGSSGGSGDKGGRAGGTHRGATAPASPSRNHE